MNDFQKYIQRYLDLIPSADWLQELRRSGESTLSLFRSISEAQGNFPYAEGKWTLKEVLQHLIDAEKIFAYRALRFAREDKTILPGWDEVAYGETYDLIHRNISSVWEEFDVVRKSSLLFFMNLNDKQLSQRGIANGNEISVKQLGKLIVGHNIHHLNVIQERYIPKFNN